ncbi:MAG: zf-TFIIB domain-containing protein [Nocardioidaceae bacterium]
MQCPTDGSTLVMSERAGIEIDYCPECRGVWLDRGELDKIIERGTQMESPQRAPQRDERRYDDDRRRDDRHYDDDDDRRYDKQYPRKKKKEHWLSEILG